MRPLVFAANWKMHLGPLEAREYLHTFLAAGDLPGGCAVWFFPPAVSLEAVAQALGGRPDLLAGAQDIHWDARGAYTGQISAPLAVQAGARATLVGHSERRHLFGETDAQTGKKVAAALAANLPPVLCVGETLAQRDAGETIAVVTRQLDAALTGPPPPGNSSVTIAYEPVWAIGTGRNATPRDAAEVHRAIRRWWGQRGASGVRILYGGSVSLKNAAELLAEREVDGVLVGGASLDPRAWAELVRTAAP
ncbi:MAG: triose-phosphate isomerase [Gemmatimonadales bacterium]